MSTATVVGGGPAGLMAAEVLARAGVAVTVYDRKPSVGRKFMLAGHGGLNITHTESRDAFLARYGSSAGRLGPMLDAFSPQDLIDWCAELGQPTMVGSSGRVFPQSFRTAPLLRAWLARLAELGVVLERRQQWTGWHGDSLDFAGTEVVERRHRLCARRRVMASSGIGRRVGGALPRSGCGRAPPPRGERGGAGGLDVGIRGQVPRAPRSRTCR